MNNSGLYKVRDILVERAKAGDSTIPIEVVEILVEHCAKVQDRLSRYHVVISEIVTAVNEIKDDDLDTYGSGRRDGILFAALLLQEAVRDGE